MVQRLIPENPLNGRFVESDGRLTNPAFALLQILIRSLNGIDITGIITDNHSSLSNLNADDHTQYHNNARALAWLGTRSTTDLPEGTNLYFTQDRLDEAKRYSIMVGS